MAGTGEDEGFCCFVAVGDKGLPCVEMLALREGVGVC